MYNYVTKAPYSGKNVDLLMASGYDNPYFLTYRQAQEIGRQVRRGETGITLQRIVTVQEIDPKTKKKRTVKKPKSFTVFNIEQTDEVALQLPLAA